MNYFRIIAYFIGQISNKLVEQDVKKIVSHHSTISLVYISSCQIWVVLLPIESLYGTKAFRTQALTSH